MSERHRPAGIRVSLLVTLLVVGAGARSSTLAAEPVVTSGAPVRLVLPSLGVDATVATFALTADLAMPVPQVGSLVAWYSFSAQAGGPGNAVLAGHRDWQRQRGVFFSIGRLATDDEVWLQDGAGTWYRYTVLWSQSYVDDLAPVEAIVETTDRPSLTLITCSGDFDRERGHYRERQVVRAELTDIVPAPQPPDAD